MSKNKYLYRYAPSTYLFFALEHNSVQKTSEQNCVYLQTSKFVL